MHLPKNILCFQLSMKGLPWTLSIGPLYSTCLKWIASGCKVLHWTSFKIIWGTTSCYKEKIPQILQSSRVLYSLIKYHIMNYTNYTRGQKHCTFICINMNWMTLLWWLITCCETGWKLGQKDLPIDVISLL
jgi:hypothetical protein